MAHKITKSQRKQESRNAAFHNSLENGIYMAPGYVGGFPRFNVNTKTQEVTKINPGTPWVNVVKHGGI